MMDKNTVNRLLIKFRDTKAVNSLTASQVAADHQVPVDLVTVWF